MGTLLFMTLLKIVIVQWEAELLDNKAQPTVDLEAHLSLNKEKTLSIIELKARPKAWDHLIIKD